MKKHKCKRPNTCQCSLTALEPNENCPIHGIGEWPPRCAICGRFMKWRKYYGTSKIKRQNF